LAKKASPRTHPAVAIHDSSPHSGDKNWIVPDGARPRKNIVIGPRSEVRDRLPEIIAPTR
jgi:hypothetical protein